MNRIKNKIGIRILNLVWLSIILITNDAKGNDPLVNRLKTYAQSIHVIDTHEHQKLPSELGINEYNFYTVLMASYLSGDVYSAGGVWPNSKLLNKLSPNQLWDTLSLYLNYSSNTSYYRHLLSGMKSVYGYNEPYFTKDGVKKLSIEIEKNYQEYAQWFDKVFKQSKFEIMFLDNRFWTPELDIDTSHFALAFNINELVLSVCSGSFAKVDKIECPVYYRYAMDLGFNIRSLNDYLSFADYCFDKAIQKNAVCLKNSLAYFRSSYYEDIPYEKAVNLFNKAPDLTSEEKKQLEDFMFHRIIEKSIKLNLPIQIHTGYFASSGKLLEQGNPLSFNNLFLQYRRARFVLFHGGYPWSGEVIAMAKMFKNVSLDLVWLAEISKSRAVIAFDEMLDCVPYNKIFWGGDCRLIEESVGALDIAQDIVIQVLVKRINMGDMSEEMAKDIILRIFRENAIDYFNLSEKLNIN